MAVAQLKPNDNLSDEAVQALRDYCPVIELTEEVDSRSGSKDGKAWKRVWQKGFLRRRVDGRELLEPVQIDLDSRSPEALPPGLYVLSPDSYEVNQYNELSLKRFGSDRRFRRIADVPL